MNGFDVQFTWNQAVMSRLISPSPSKCCVMSQRWESMSEPVPVLSRAAFATKNPEERKKCLLVNTKTSCCAQLYLIYCPVFLVRLLRYQINVIWLGESIFVIGLQQVQYWFVIVEHQLVRDCPHWEEAEDVGAADAHEEVEDVVDTPGRLPVLDLNVVHQTLEDDEDWGEGKCEHRDDVPAVCGVLEH